MMNFSVEPVLAFLGSPRKDPSPDYLDELVAAYVRRVPWETASRIAKRAQTAATEQCPRWPEEFWRDVLERGGGGTCYESNYAFFALLRGLGFEGYLTINDMGALCGCHAAIVVQMERTRWLVDVGYPLYLPVALRRDAACYRSTPFHTYTVTPAGAARYEVTRDRHPKPYVFTLNDRPVADSLYRQITTQDYGPAGQFLDELIVHKVIGDRIWRFNGRARPPLLESFPASTQAAPTSTVVAEDSTVQVVSERFRLDEGIVASAMRALQKGVMGS